MLAKTLGLRPPSVTHPATHPRRDRRSSRIQIAARHLRSACSQDNHTRNKMLYRSTSGSGSPGRAYERCDGRFSGKGTTTGGLEPLYLAMIVLPSGL
jgi:hypothetical protein